MTYFQQNGFGIGALKWLSGVLIAIALTACGGGGGGGGSDPVVDNPVQPIAALPTCTATVSASAPLTNITSIQGTQSTSPLQSQTLTVRGIVVGSFQNSTTPTAVTQLNGFFIQQPVADNDPLTSEGLFVFAPSAIAVSAGDYVQVEGRVTEFGALPNSITQLAGTVTVSICGRRHCQHPRRSTCRWLTSMI